LLYRTRALLEAVVVPIHLYELATAAAAKHVGGVNVARANLRLTIVGSSGFVLHDDACVTTHTMSSPKADAKLETQLNAQVPGEPGALAARLVNRVLSNFHVERDHFGNQQNSAPMVRLDPEAYEKYLCAVGIKKAPEQNGPRG
jgi:hypothetical protein